MYIDIEWFLQKENDSFGRGEDKATLSSDFFFFFTEPFGLLIL